MLADPTEAQILVIASASRRDFSSFDTPQCGVICVCVCVCLCVCVCVCLGVGVVLRPLYLLL
jgi:hypothetical protein